MRDSYVLVIGVLLLPLCLMSELPSPEARRVVKTTAEVLRLVHELNTLEPSLMDTARKCLVQYNPRPWSWKWGVRQIEPWLVRIDQAIANYERDRDWFDDELTSEIALLRHKQGHCRTLIRTLTPKPVESKE